MQIATLQTISRLKKDICALQGGGGGADDCAAPRLDFGLLDGAFPQGGLPLAAVHEFVSSGQSNAAATSGFVSGLLNCLLSSNGPCFWVSARRTVYPPALKAFGICPERIVFVDVRSDRDALWALEEALKCKGVAAVVGEVRRLDFTASRRLQLAVEQSRATGFIHSYNSRSEPTACVSRWQITPLHSVLDSGLPGVGHPRWHVRLLKVRNGRPGS